MDASNSPGVLYLYVYYILYALLSNYWAALLDVVIRGLFGFIQVKKSMKNLNLNNKNLLFLGKRQKR